MDNTTDKNNFAVGEYLTAVSTKTICFCGMCLLIQYGFYTKLSPVSVNERKKCLVKSEKDSGAHRPPTPIVAKVLTEGISSEKFGDWQKCGNFTVSKYKDSKTSTQDDRSMDQCSSTLPLYHYR